MRRISPWVLVLLLVPSGCSSTDAPSSAAPDGSVGDDGSTPNTDGGSGADTGGTNGAGIAAKYPGDMGIENDPDVIFADGFESDTQASDLSKKWDNFFQVSDIGIATDAPHVWSGAKALEFTLPQQTTELSNGVQKILTTELDVLYLRYYSKFDASFDITGSSHNGGGINAHYFIGNMATPGVPADGTNKFLVEYECWRGQASDKSPGTLNVYVYWPDQRSNYGDHFFPDGLVDPNTSIPNNFGPTFVPRTDVTPDLDLWYEYELMVKANTPGQRDGRITIWLDGQVIGDFPNLRLRDINSLKIDRFNLSLHARSNPNGVTHKWYDNVVAAKAYIGPMVH